MLPILIVDDVREDLMLAEAALRHCKILNPIYLMTTGQECINYFDGQWKSPEGARPERCLLFLDLAMQPISGSAVLRAIANTQLARESFLVVLTGIEDIKTVREGYQAGAKTFLIKPLTTDDILRLLASA